MSSGCFSSLNFAHYAGETKDDPENIYKNYLLAASLLGKTPEETCLTFQLHTDEIVVAELYHKGIGITKPPFGRGVDGLITREDMVISVRVADCVPVLLYDKKTNTAAALHSGWRGTQKGISEKAAGIMTGMGADPAEIIAALGPSVKSCCFSVGEEFYGLFPDCGEAFVKTDGSVFFDIPKAIKKRLINAGLREENIEICNLCTCCEEELFFSHRRQGVNRGAMAAFITPKSKQT